MPVIPLINPKRPPKKWWDDCTKGVRRSKTQASPQSVCGSLWYHKMSDAQRKAATKRHEKGAKLSLNPFMLKPKAPAKKWYVGKPVNSRSFVMFQSDTNPTQATHGHVYSYAIGSFSTKLGATIMTRHGYNNPHIQTVSDAEALARRGTSWLLSQGFHV